VFLKISSRLEKLSPKARVEELLIVEEEVVTEEENLKVKKEARGLGRAKAVRMLTLGPIRTPATEDQEEVVETPIVPEVVEVEDNVTLVIFLRWVRCQELLAECFF
jgi:hypothetical protein